MNETHLTWHAEWNIYSEFDFVYKLINDNYEIYSSGS